MTFTRITNIRLSIKERLEKKLFWNGVAEQKSLRSPGLDDYDTRKPPHKKNTSHRTSVYSQVGLSIKAEVILK